MENSKKLIILLLFILIVTNLQAEKEKAFAFYPFGAYSEETSVFLGSYALYTFRPENLPENYKPSSLELNLIVSYKKQVRILLRNKIFLAEGKYSLGIPLRYYLWPTTFYAVGNQENTDLKEDYTRQYFEFYPYFQYHFKKNITFSTIAYLEKSRITKSDTENSLLAQNVTGYDDYLLSGIGFGLNRDTTDKGYFPTSGSSLTYQVQFYHKSIGSDFNFRKSTFDYRKYATLSPSQTLAGQFLLKTVSGTTPFEKLPDLGNEIRGFDSHKYINDQIVMLRLEDRIFPWQKAGWQRFGFAAFLETGQAMASFSELSIDHQKYSAGIGLRYIMLPLQKLTLRFDFAVSEDGYEMEIISFEAF
ncbi:MAG: outer membrane protein assembly factor [Candidatus Cloacimonetes bacterium]|nr:outer membrane protein assembly factor [Candidatus Cloacimonadota bacterium]